MVYQHPLPAPTSITMSFDFISSKPQAVTATRNSLSVDGALYHRLLAKLDDCPSKGAPNPSRVYRRLQYAHPNLCIHIESDSHNSRALVVASRNLSQGGASFLHSSYMYPGTLLTIDLVNNSGKIVPRRGTITRCEHRGGRVHEIGVKFDKEVSLREFLHQNPETLLYAWEKVNEQEMKISVMIYSQQAEFSSLMREYLQDTSLRYTFAKTEEEASEKYTDQDMLICHLCDETPDMPETIRKMRLNGFKNPIILMGCPKSSIETLLLSAYGIDMAIPLPSNQQTVLGSIAEYVFNDWTPESLESVRSCVSPESKKQLAIELAKTGVALNQQISTRDQQAIQSSCHRVGMIAPLLGKNALKTAVDNLAERLNVEGSVEELTPELSEISSICKSSRSAA